MTYDNNNQQERPNDGLYSKRLKAGKRRTYFFDVRTTRGNDYFLTITESKKRFSDNGYDRHKIFLYKEDFNKFIVALGEAVDFVKTELLPDFDFDQFNHEDYDHQEGGHTGSSVEEPAAVPEETVAAQEESVREDDADGEVVSEVASESNTSPGPRETEDVDTW